MASPTATKIPVGTILSEKYRVTREIGRGGMAAVYEAENVDIGKRVAIKVLAQELTTSMVVVERFFREARAAAAIRSPYICDVYDSGRLDEGPPFLVLELLEGESLYERMTKVRYFDIPTTLAIVSQVCRGLTKAHAANIVHRDLKPENIFIAKDEDGALLAKILDFGLAKFYTPLDGSGDAKQSRLTREGAVFGTPAYMSPEQVRGQGAVDHRADLWALACIVYECFTGRTVWQTEQGVAMTFAQIASAPVPDPLVYRPDLPPSFKDWFDKALDRRIDQRYQTAREFSDELIAALDPSARLDTSGAFRVDGSGSSGLYVRVTAPGPASPEPDGSELSLSQPPPPPPNPALAVPVPAAGGVPEMAPRGTTATFEAPPRAPDVNNRKAVQVSDEKPTQTSTFLLIGALVGALIGGGYVVWSKMQADPKTPVVATSVSAPVASAPPPVSAAPSAKAVPETPPAPVLPWRPFVAEAQEKLVTGDHKGALKSLKEAFDKGGHGVPRTMLDHVQVAIASAAAKSSCTLTGLGRPRTYDLHSVTSRRVSAGRPYIALGTNGPVVTWTDTHEGLEHAYTAVLDNAMRTIAEPIDITPEGGRVQLPVVVSYGSDLPIIYTDGRGNDAGVHARLLAADGTIGSPMVNIAPLKEPNSGSAIAKAADGTYVAVWTAEVETGSEELFMRRLSAKLEPLGEVVRATDFAPSGLQKPRVRLPSVAVADEAAQITFRLERSPQQIIYRMRVPLADLGKGVEPRKKGESTDRWIGEAVVVNTDRSRGDTSSIACSKEECFLVWDNEVFGGVSAAAIDPATAQPLWRDKFSRTGGHPTVAFDEAGNARIVWFEKGGIMTAPVTRAKVGAPAKIARVSGAQPAPAVIPGKTPGEWLIAWLDFEAGLLEPYVARFVCP
ncbi:MAG: protein kinase [Polyangiaceae bacterium]|nr:protein kinase [Polyangiaceae bacterium]